MTVAIDCPRCSNPVEAPPLEVAKLMCGICGAAALGLAGAVAAKAGADMPEAAIGGAASCFFHSGNAAFAACTNCGRFVCRLCDFEIEGRRLCPNCLEVARRMAALASLRDRDQLPDSRALAFSVGWILFYPVWLAAAPAVVYLSIRYWKAPRRYLIPRAPWRYMVAWICIFAPPALLVLALLIGAHFRLRAA